MSLDIGKEKCAVCGAYLFEEDDVVHCPECGAPHHRECYLSLGHCGLEHLHGTDNQYKKAEPQKETEPEVEEQVFCGMCGAKYQATQKSCPNCNAPNMAKMNSHVISFDLMGGVSDDTDLGEGVTAKEAKQFVVGNTHRYLPKFLKFKHGKKASWNWLAFLTPCGWLLSRKMYLLGAIIGAVQVALTMLSLPLNAALSQLDLSQVNGYFEIVNLIRDNISVIGWQSIIAAALGSLLGTLVMVLFGVFGDYIYRNKVISDIAEIKKSDLDQEEAFRKKGGVSFFIGVLGYFAVQELPTIIAYTLGMFS